MQNLFPPKPSGINKAITQASAAFKKEVARVFFLCLLFLLSYILLLGIVTGIAILVGYLGFMLVYEVHNFACLMIAIGAAGMGIMLIYFMIRSLIIKKAEPVSTIEEITPVTEPVLYSFINKVCDEARASQPKKIFLVDEVNAFVRYDSIFLSLFFPARKNLYIGLGLINSLTITEFKAVLAHEFGHFSQGSMRFGSYVYHFNQIIYKMVEDNSGYNAILEKIAGTNGYFSFFANLNLKIVQGIQELIARFYKTLNRGYMGLARQMEFHADAIAASVAGSEPLIAGLYRLDLAGKAYEDLLTYYNNQIKENYKAGNLYAHHFKLMQLLAIQSNVELKNGYPMISASSIDQMGRNRIVVTDQWASHPSVEDREAALLRLGICSEQIIEPAWKLFKDAPATQAANTERLYESVSFTKAPVSIITDAQFESKYLEFFNLNTFQPLYKNYYDQRDIAHFDIVPEKYHPEDLPVDELFADQYSRIPKMISRIEEDLAILESISVRGAGYKSFDFEGNRYPIEDAASIRSFLNKELAQFHEQLNAHDREIFYIAHSKAKTAEHRKEIEDAFTKMFDQITLTAQDLKLYREMAEDVAPVYAKHSHEEIKVLVLKIIYKEKELKARMEEILVDENISLTYPCQEELEQIKRFCGSHHIYFAEGKYLDDQLELLCTSSNAFLNVTTGYCFQLKKKALTIQAQLLKEEAASVSA